MGARTGSVHSRDNFTFIFIQVRKGIDGLFHVRQLYAAVA